MSETTEPLPLVPVVWPSVDDAKPMEEGGAIARTGFNYQDEIAVGFLIDMLGAPPIIKVHCETHDDIVVVHETATGAQRVVEYVQVKASEQDKLWSVADICRKKDNKDGSSIYESSLLRDKHAEDSRFRLVTLRPITKDLDLLKRPFSAPCRSKNSDEICALLKELTERFPELCSAKGNSALYWLQNCFWDERHDEATVQKDNQIKLIKLGIKEQRGILFEQADVLLLQLRGMAKDAGAAKWSVDPTKKCVTRLQLRLWWEERTADLAAGSASKSGGKLAEKMRDAALPDDVIALAIEMRRGYATASRTPRYLDVNASEALQRRVQSEVMSLRARHAAGLLALNGAEFHSECVSRMDAVNAERVAEGEDRAAYLKGCMYDIADRCLLRFARPA
jgi:Cap4 dsDNA endonuclease